MNAERNHLVHGIVTGPRRQFAAARAKQDRGLCDERDSYAAGSGIASPDGLCLGGAIACGCSSTLTLRITRAASVQQRPTNEEKTVRSFAISADRKQAN